jgi:hypothetical protein
MSDQLRVQRLIDNARQNNANLALARARILYGNTCSSCKADISSNLIIPTQSELLTANTTACAERLARLYRDSPLIWRIATPESTRIASKIQCVLDASIDPNNPELRFKDLLPRVVPAPCPPLPPVIKPTQTTLCPLPNTPLNPVPPF